MTGVATATVRADQSLHEAFAAAAASGDRLAVVVDGAGRAVAAVTDGDVRRAVLRGVDLHEPVGSIVSSAPLLVPADEPDDQVCARMLGHGLSAVATVDADGRPVGVRRLADLAPDAVAAPVGVLMVGGRGERLRPLTDKVPKPLLRIGGAPIVQRLPRPFPPPAGGGGYPPPDH